MHIQISEDCLTDSIWNSNDIANVMDYTMMILTNDSQLFQHFRNYTGVKPSCVFLTDGLFLSVNATWNIIYGLEFRHQKPDETLREWPIRQGQLQRFHTVQKIKTESQMLDTLQKKDFQRAFEAWLKR